MDDERDCGSRPVTHGDGTIELLDMEEEADDDEHKTDGREWNDEDVADGDAIGLSYAPASQS